MIDEKIFDVNLYLVVKLNYVGGGVFGSNNDIKKGVNDFCLNG